MTGFTASSSPLHRSPSKSNDTPTEHSLDVVQVLTGLRWREPETNIDADLIRYLARPNVVTFHLEEGRLTYRATEAEHRRIAEMLRGLERGGPCQIVTEIRVLDLPLPLVAKFDWRPAPDGSHQTPTRPLRTTLLTEDELGQLVRRTSREPECSILMAPKITMFNGQTGTLFVGDEQPFCTDVRRSESGAIEPAIELVECGVRLSVSPTALDDGSIEFALGLRTAEIGRIELANLPPLDPTSREGTTVQIPRVAMESVDLSLSLEDGRSLAVAVPKTFDPQATNNEAAARASRSVVLYVFTCRRIPGTDRL